MRTRGNLGLMVVAGIAILTLTSCRQAPELVVRVAMDQSQAQLAQGNVDGALASLRRVYDDKRCASFHPQLLSTMMYINLSTNRMTAAQALFREVAARDAAEAAPLIGMIEERLLAEGRNDDLAAWCESLQGFAFGEAPLQTLSDLHFKALDAAQRSSEVIKVIPAYLARLSEGAGLALVERRFAAALRARSSADAAALIALVAAGPASPARTGAEARMRVDLMLMDGQRAEAEAFFKAKAASLPEDAACAILRKLAESVGPDRAPADALCRFVLDGIKDRPALRSVAADLWMAAARAQGSVAEAVTRLTVLRKDGFEPTFLIGQIDRHYGFIMDKGTRVEFAPLLALGQELMPGLKEDERGRLAGIMLDLCFYLENFQTALDLVEKGIPGRDEKWTKTLASKVRAHLYLQQGKPQESVACFREFMGYIAQEEGDQIDPIKGTRVTKEMILGLNAKRIGDILAGASDAAGAAKAYQEARDYYQTALKSFGEKTPEYAKLKEDLAAVPGNATP